MEMSDEKNVLKFEWVDNPDQIGEMNFTFTKTYYIWYMVKYTD